MSISDKRVSLTGISAMVKSNYDTTAASEAISSARTSAASSVNKASGGAQSVFDTSSVSTPTTIEAGVVGTVQADCDGVNANLNFGLDSNLDRGLGEGLIAPICPGSLKNGDIVGVATNAVLAAIPELREGIKDLASLPGTYENELNEMLSVSVKDDLNLIGLSVTTLDCVLGGSKKELFNGLNNIGFTIGAKKRISDLFKSLGNCLDSAIQLDEGGIALRGVGQAGTLGTLSKMDITHTVNFASSIGTDAKKRESFFIGLKSSIKNDPTDIENKIMLLNSVKQNVDNDKQTDSEIIMTSSMTPVVLEAISKSDKVSNSPVSDYDDLTSSLTTMDRNWNRDREDPDVINYNAVKGNKRMVELSKSKLMDRRPTGSDMSTGIVTKDIADDTALNILLVQ